MWRETSVQKTSIACLWCTPRTGPYQNLGMCTDQESNWQPLALEDSTQTEAH